MSPLLSRGVFGVWWRVIWANVRVFEYRYGHEGVDDNVEFDEDRDGSSDDKEIDVDEI